MGGLRGRFGIVSLLALAAGLGAASAAEAQGRWLRGPDAGFLALGASGIATAELDAALAARGYPTFGRTALAPSLGAYWTLPGGVMLGGEWHGLMWDEEAHEGREVGLGGGYATVGVGYALDVSPRARVYPRVGIGGGGMGLWLEREGAAVPFDDALAEGDDPAEPDSHTLLSREGVVVDLGAGLEIRPGAGSRGLVVGLRLGYLTGPFPTGWRTDDRPVSGAPPASLAGPYIRVMLGGRRR
ncbi:MAG TPA: hypothetical protein VFZ18_14930 [Longimicrobiaceae bacterium]